MRITNACAAMVLVFVAAAVAADDKKAAPKVTWDTTMPSIELSNQPLEKVLIELKEKMPGFEFTITRENVPHDYPVFPEDMNVENVSLGQFLDLLPTYFPGIQIESERTQSLFQDSGVRPAEFPPAPPPPPSPHCTLIIGPDPDAQPPVVRVFALDNIIAYRSSLNKDGDQAAREKQATDDVLSLIQAAEELADEKPFPVMKIHTATKTLLFKGTAAQADIAAGVLAALQPTDNPRSLQAAFDAAVAEHKQLKEQLPNLKGSTTKPGK